MEPSNQRQSAADLFDSFAPHYNTLPWQIDLSRRVRDKLSANLEFLGLQPEDGRERKLLDYACGPGNLTLALFGPPAAINSAVGVDVSPAMAGRYNETFSQLELSAHGVSADLCLPDEPEPEAMRGLTDFDVAGVALGLHHFHEPELCIERLAQRVKKGSGVVVIVDFVPSDKKQHGQSHDEHRQHHHNARHGQKDGADMSHTITRNGFSEADARSMFEKAGVDGDFGYMIIPEPFSFGSDKPEKYFFIARGTRR